MSLDTTIYSGDDITAAWGNAVNTALGNGNVMLPSSYTLYKTGSVYYARNGVTGANDFSNSSFHTVFNNAVGALTSGGNIFIMAGTYTVTGVLTMNQDNVHVWGAGFKNTKLTTASLNTKIIYLTASYCSINNVYLGCTAGTPLTGNAGITIADSTTSRYDNKVSNVYIDRVYNGIVNNKAYGSSFHHIRMSQIKNDAFLITNANDTFIHDAVTSSGTLLGAYVSVGAGVHVTKTGGVWISDSDFLDHFYGLLSDPATGNSVEWLWITNSAFDNSGTDTTGDGVYVHNGNGGTVAGVFFSAGWCSGWYEGHGFHMKGVDKFTLIGSCVQNVYKSTVKLDTGCVYSKIIGNQLEKWNHESAATNYGVHVVAGVTYFKIIGNDIVNPENAVESIGVVAGASDYYQITGNSLPGGVVNAGTGTNQYHNGNIGWITWDAGVTPATVADGGPVAVNITAGTITWAVASGTVAGEIVTVSTLDSDHFHVDIKTNAGAAGTDQVIHYVCGIQYP